MVDRSEPRRRAPGRSPAPRHLGRVALAAVTGLALALSWGGAVTAAQGARLSPAAAIRLADVPARLGAVGPTVVRSATARTARDWGPPLPAGVGPDALLWHVTLSGAFRVSPCPPPPGGGSPPVAVCMLPNCPVLPPWPRPAPVCYGIWHRIATVSVADASGAWLGVTYGPAVGFGRWAPPPRVVDHPRSGETIVLATGQFLLLGPALTLPGGRLGPYRSSRPAVIAAVTPPVAAGSTAFVAEHPGETVITAIWRPGCPPGVACPEYAIAVTLRILVLAPGGPTTA